LKPIKYIPLLLLLVFIGCENDEQRRIPDAPVYLELDLTGRYSTFRNPYDTVVYDYNTPKTVKDYIGFGGILVNVGYDGNYYAYDLACPYDVDPGIRVYPDRSGMKAICKSCGSEFEIWNGTGMVSKKPSKWNLRRYQAVVRNNILFISR
jgi:nitrite reductase/ring-hydroxylating ferredoxin subunit